MLLTLLYMIATWVQSWRLSSLKARLSTVLLNSESVLPSIMLYTSPHQARMKEDFGNCKHKQNNDLTDDLLSSRLCSNKHLARLGDLLWFQGDKRLCTIFPKQTIDVSDWLLYPYGKSIFPLSVQNNAETFLQENLKMHVLVEADLDNYVPLASAKATKLEDYGIIITWMSDDVFGAILETDLDHITKFSTNLMQGQCFINNGLLVSRIESVSVSGKPCVCNYEQLNLLDNKKLIGKAQWDAHIKKLRLVSSTARLVSQQSEPIEVKEIPGVIVSPGSKPISLQMPITQNIPDDLPRNDDSRPSSVPSTPPPTPVPANSIINGMVPKLGQALSRPSLSPSPLDLSAVTSSNTSLTKSQELILEESSEEDNSGKTVIGLKDEKDSPKTLSSKIIIPTTATTCTPSKKTEIGPINFRKPPNILIYADSSVAVDNVRNVLETTLSDEKYAVYTLSTEQAQKDVWMDQAVLVIVCGNVSSEIASQVVEYIVRGGKLLALCSDILKTLLPTFKTAEVRENELVCFSYGKWKHVRMMHHVFCYQASPVKTKFSHDPDDFRTSVTPPTPVSANVIDKAGKLHSLQVQVLGSEETWHTPSILLANLPASGGKAVFSQIHLEADPSQYEFEESKFNALKQSNAIRLEIFGDLLASHLGIEINPIARVPFVYTPGFFLGRHELKLEVLQKLKSKMQADDVLKTTKLEIQFCGTTTKAKPATETFLPVMVHRCPENFSTVEYFENLRTEAIGRLVIYADVLTSSMDVIGDNTILQHGLAVIPYQQSKGRGRSQNQWLSPKGCAMFSLQLHIPIKSELGERISLLQHLICIAVVSAVRSIPGYQNIDLRIKWPNDIYTENGTKVAGLLVTTLLQPPFFICTVGMGINLSNSKPTTCINDIITKHNEVTKTNLQKLSYETFLARVFSEIESLLNTVQEGKIDHFYELYYKYWLHTDAEITVVSEDGTYQEVRIMGIDNFGFLEVMGRNGRVFTVHPDGNSFDILQGLIAPKF